MAYVMIVDDDEDFAIAVATMLREAGHEVVVELNLNSAVDSMLRRRPNLLILDVMFPENSSGGFELAWLMRNEHPQLMGIPILLLTAVNSKLPLGFRSRQAQEQILSIAGFLEKPVDLDLLRNRVSVLLEETNPKHETSANEP